MTKSRDHMVKLYGADDDFNDPEWGLQDKLDNALTGLADGSGTCSRVATDVQSMMAAIAMSDLPIADKCGELGTQLYEWYGLVLYYAQQVDAVLDEISEVYGPLSSMTPLNGPLPDATHTGNVTKN
jgi:hypothetical protein